MVGPGGRHSQTAVGASPLRPDLPATTALTPPEGVCGVHLPPALLLHHPGLLDGGS